MMKGVIGVLLAGLVGYGIGLVFGMSLVSILLSFSVGVNIGQFLNPFAVDEETIALREMEDEFGIRLKSVNTCSWF